MNRQERLETIRKHADKFDAVAHGYRLLLRMAEQEETTDAFLALVEAAGTMTSLSLSQLATTLEILQDAGVPSGSVPDDWRTRPVASDYGPPHFIRRGFLRGSHD